MGSQPLYVSVFYVRSTAAVQLYHRLEEVQLVQWE